MNGTAAYRCYISLGANLGQREQNLCEALQRLGQLQHTSLEVVSSFYETAPWGRTAQPAFLNAAALLRTSLEPVQLLLLCQGIEQALGRQRKEKWGPRTIDIDLLHVPGYHLESTRLMLPHPYLLKRAFVLVPLAEIAPDENFAGRTFQSWCEACEDKKSVQKILFTGRNFLRKS